MDELLLKPCATCGSPPRCYDYGGIMIVECSRRNRDRNTNCFNATAATLEEAVQKWNALPPQQLVIDNTLQDLLAKEWGEEGKVRKPRNSGRRRPRE